MKLFIVVMFIIVIVIYYKLLYDRNKLAKEYNSLLNKYNEEVKQKQYYKECLNETLKHKRALETFIRIKINPNLSYDSIE